VAEGLGAAFRPVALMASTYHYAGMSRRYDYPVRRRVAASRRRSAPLKVARSAITAGRTARKARASSDLLSARMRNRRAGRVNRLTWKRQVRWPRGAGRKAGRWR